MKKFLRTSLKVLICFIAIIVLLMLAGFILQKTYYRKQLEAIKPYGTMVEVEGSKIHVYQRGEGEETIVLLSGLAVELPSADFGPLMRVLSKEYRVVVVEHFGTGFSDRTEKPRTSENYVNEMREALKQAGIQPPYILMPHSISGIYSEYYASRYPEEIRGLILLDSTPTTQFPMDLYRGSLSILKLGKFVQDIGLFRLLIKLTADDSIINSTFSQLSEEYYSQKELEDYRKYRSFSLNSTVLKQQENILNCIEEVKAFVFPKEIPVLKIIAKETLEYAEIDGEKYQEDHLKRLGEHAQSVVLDGSHMIYYTQVEEIKRLTDDFVSKLKGVGQEG